MSTLTLFPLTAAPAGNKMLQPDDALDVLEELIDAENVSSELGLKLKLPQTEVEAIHSTYLKPRIRLLHIIITFLKQEQPTPTWRVIVEALRSPEVNLVTLAEKMEANYFPNPSSTRDVGPEMTDTGNH